MIWGNGIMALQIDADARHADRHALLARNWWAVLARGIAAVLFGICALLLPGLVLLTLALLFAIYLLVDGLFAILAAIRAARHHERWGLLVAEGVLDAVLGAAIVIMPAAAVLGLVYLTAAWAVLTGILMLGTGFGLKATHGSWWLLLGGALSIAWGALLLILPFFGALVLTWWFAGYAIAFGVLMCAAAFKLRSQRTPTVAPA
jgi:uncharacterized membrane protein HdeD (DUF308 family)